MLYIYMEYINVDGICGSLILGEEFLGDLLLKVA